MAKRISDVEDGFATKRLREGASASGRNRKAVRGECTIPPPPVKHILGSFTLSNPASARAIREYVESQAGGERVQHAERVSTEHVFDRDYDCWDVHTQRDRYWSSLRQPTCTRSATSRALTSRFRSTLG